MKRSPPARRPRITEQEVLAAIHESLARVAAEDAAIVEAKKAGSNEDNPFYLCWYSADEIVGDLKAKGIHAVRVGYATPEGYIGDEEAPNEEALVASDCLGHDLALVMGRWIVDYWAVSWEGHSKKMVLDLQKPADLREARRLYGRRWVDEELPNAAEMVARRERRAIERDAEVLEEQAARSRDPWTRDRLLKAAREERKRIR